MPDPITARVEPQPTRPEMYALLICEDGSWLLTYLSTDRLRVESELRHYPGSRLIVIPGEEPAMGQPQGFITTREQAIAYAKATRALFAESAVGGSMRIVADDGYVRDSGLAFCKPLLKTTCERAVYDILEPLSVEARYWLYSNFSTRDKSDEDIEDEVDFWYGEANG